MPRRTCHASGFRPKALYRNGAHKSGTRNGIPHAEPGERITGYTISVEDKNGVLRSCAATITF